ncbi:DnaJ domain [Dillenia turbinata]|uniref:DnaJ domain n=1 Tax=Dillenia turbinata TaxID=194707 RepID=A0AAN8Z7E0_9MAGN
MEESSKEGERLLGLAEELLRFRDFSNSRNYALKAKQCNPSLHSIPQLLAIVDVLVASQIRINNHKDWYAILQVDRKTQNPDSIRLNYKKLLFLLSPSKNKFQFAHEASSLIMDAWSVLSNPTRKSLYDKELDLYAETARDSEFEKRSSRVSGGEKIGDEEMTFWTACPYCFYMYEYPRFFEDRCLMCQNERCRRGFHGVPISLPQEMISGKNDCYYSIGFYPIGFSGHNPNTNSDFGKSNLNWTPVFPLFACGQGVAGERSGGGGMGPNGSEENEESGFVEVSGQNVYEKQAEAGPSNVRRPTMRKKTVAKNSRTWMRRGFRGRRQEGVDVLGEGRPDLNVDEGTETGSEEEGGTERVQFYDGLDDIFVGFPTFPD